MKYPIIKPIVSKFQDRILDDLRGIIDSNMLTNVNRWTAEFENGLRDYVGNKECVAVSSGTSGLILSLQAMGIRDGEVIIPSFTFAATAAAAYWTGNRIVYSDIDDTFTISPEDVNEKISRETKAIIGVHMYGNPCHIKELTEISVDNSIPLIFDSAHALGSSYQGKSIGNFGDIEVLSLSPTKLITSVEGGAVLTNSNEISEKVRLLRNYGLAPDYSSDLPGLNARLSEIHACIGHSQLPHIDDYVSRRNNYVNWYKQLLKKRGGISFQKVIDGNTNAHKDFSIVINREKFGMDRNELAKALAEKGIGVKFYFYPPMHQLNAYKDDDVHLPVTEEVSHNLISLPIYNDMKKEDIEYIAEAVLEA